jgi:hypothetical protein
MSDKTTETFEDEIAFFDKLATSKQTAYNAACQEMQALAGQLLEAKDGERPALIKKRSALVAERDALRDEVSEAKRRRDSATLAIAQLEYDLALTEARRLAELGGQQRKKLDEAIREEQHFLNAGRRGMDKAAGDVELLRISTQLALARAESQILARDAEQAGNLAERAKADLEVTRAELGITSGPGDL